MSHNDQHLTTEQLSAFLDQQLSPEEQAVYRLHMPACMQCQQEQKELQQMISLLRALPEPVLPRTFVLPESLSAASVLRQKMLLPAKITVAGRGKDLPPYMRRTLQFMSALAAVVGIIFILSGLLYSLSLGSSTVNSTTSAGVQKSAAQSVGTPAFHGTSPASVSNSGVETQAAGTPALLPLKTPVTSPHAAPQNATPLQATVDTPAPRLWFFDLNSASGRLGLGLILALAGFVGLMALKQRGKHRRLS